MPNAKTLFAAMPTKEQVLEGAVIITTALTVSTLWNGYVGDHMAMNIHHELAPDHESYDFVACTLSGLVTTLSTYGASAVGALGGKLLFKVVKIASLAGYKAVNKSEESNDILEDENVLNANKGVGLYSQL